MSIPGPHPEVSVVTPCHNAAAYLEEMLVSVLSQSFADLEVILVDDGSTDDPHAVVEAIGDRRVRTFRTAASGGPSRPRNLALAQARGRIVFFFDADDVMLPGKIEAQMAAFERHPGMGLVFTDFQVIDARGQVTMPSYLADFRMLDWVRAAGVDEHGGLDRARLFRGLVSGNFIGTSSVAVRKSVLDEVGGFDESLPSSEDLHLWLRITEHHPATLVDRIGHSYRVHGQNLTREGTLRHPLSRIEVLDAQWSRARSWADRRALQRRLSLNHAEAGFLLERDNAFEKARAHYWASLRNNPNVWGLWGLVKTVPGLGSVVRRLRDVARR